MFVLVLCVKLPVVQEVCLDVDCKTSGTAGNTTTVSFLWFRKFVSVLVVKLPVVPEVCYVHWEGAFCCWKQLIKDIENKKTILAQKASSSSASMS